MIYTSRVKKLFELHQKITLWANEYQVLKEDQLAAYVKQKVFALREQFTLYSDRTQSVVLAFSKARNIQDISPKFDILDSDGKHLATVKKEFKKSLVSSTWNIYSDAEFKRLAFRISESNTSVAIARRFWNFTPFLNEAPFPIKFHFTIYAKEKTVGEYRKLTLFRDHYALYLDESHSKSLDERVWMIFAVLLDAMQSR